MIDVAESFSDTTNAPLYSALTSAILNGVSTSSPDVAGLFASNSTVISVVGVVPSPAKIFVMFTRPPVGPTILNSSIFG